MSQIIYKNRMTTRPAKDTKIFALKAPGVNERKVLKVAKKFNLSGRPFIADIEKTPDKFIYTEGKFQLIMDRISGSYRMMNLHKWQFDDGESSISYDEKEAKRLAMKFIEKYEIAPKSELKFMKTTRLEVTTVKKGESNSENRIIDYGVVFQRHIDGVPVEGPGGKIIVYLDAKKEYVGCDVYWREIKNVRREVPSKKLKKPEFFESSLKYHTNKLKMPKVEVEDVKFAYFDLGQGYRQQYLQPVYMAPYSVKSENDQFLSRSFHIKYAAERPVGKFKNPTYQRPEPSRRRQ